MEFQLEAMTKRYHYTECGLDYVYLVNGYRWHETPNGRGISIDDADGLHDVIALGVIISPHAMRGQEVRFLRSMLDISQAGLGDILGASRATVARWEGGPNEPIPGTADRMLRLFYAIKVRGHEIAESILDMLTEIVEHEHRSAEFVKPKSGWQERKAA